MFIGFIIGHRLSNWLASDRQGVSVMRKVMRIVALLLAHRRDKKRMAAGRAEGLAIPQRRTCAGSSTSRPLQTD